MKNDEPRPGDLFVDRYMPGASAKERDEAIANLEGLLTVLIQIDDRLARDSHSGDSRESDSFDRFDSLHV